jgi:hypothetical protein
MLCSYTWHRYRLLVSWVPTVGIIHTNAWYGSYQLLVLILVLCLFQSNIPLAGAVFTFHQTVCP